ncbi:HIT family hydrolase [Clostridium sp. CS001]|uniref:HIT family protein n=1 Tax=Clostridium sp. CS001 TaxID=2880648 RepID=UPI001CF0DFB3|nr:HIT family hydrolase [Clostridium sp. CS001]MCB2290895.1 HIT family hydrolase [Clostridium sp. CS001]
MFTDILNREWSCQCIGCSIASGEVLSPGGIIAETKNFILHQDPEIPIKGFLIIGSKSHIKSISELSSEESRELFDLVYRARIALNNVSDLKEVTIIQEERSGHFHLWLLPRYQWMNEQFANSLSTVREIMNYAKNNLKSKENIESILLQVENVRKILNG